MFIHRGKNISGRVNNFFFFVPFRNTNKIVDLLGTSLPETVIPSSVNLTNVLEVSADDYQEMIASIKKFNGSEFSKLGLDTCSIEDELNKVRA